MVKSKYPQGIAARIVEKLFRYAKQDSEYALPYGISSSILLLSVLRYGIMIFRGLLQRWRFGKVQGLLFLGNRVRIRSGKYIRCGRSFRVHDYVTIDGFSIDGVNIGDNVTIREYSIIECTGVLRYPGMGLTIGDNVGISQYCFIGSRGPVVIGNDVQIGPRVTIYAENHNFDDSEVSIRSQGVNRHGITIQDDCWLGSGCTILDGVTLGHGCVVAAGAVVTKSFAPYSVIAGIPGRCIRQRGDNRGRTSTQDKIQQGDVI